MTRYLNLSPGLKLSDLQKTDELRNQNLSLKNTMADKDVNDIYYKLDEILRELKEVNKKYDKITIKGEDLVKPLEKGKQKFT